MTCTQFSQVLADHCKISVGAFSQFGENVVLGRRCKKISIGVGCFLGRDIYIDVEELIIGDYVTIHHGTVIHGVKTDIGHNCWIGHYSIIDSLAGHTRIGNNVGIGAHSQLWSHMKFGDVMEGCRWCSSKNLIIDDDVWFVGHSIVGPIHAKSRSMLMTGSVAVSNMEENHIYSGSPAKDMTEKFSTQFKNRTIKEKEKIFRSYVQDYELKNNDISFIEIVDFIPKSISKEKTIFCIKNRSYVPRYSEDEYNFMKYLLYEKAKFLPFTA